LGAITIQLTLINAVHLNSWQTRLNDAHHPFAHIAVKRIVAAKRRYTLVLEIATNLMEQRTHLHEGFGIGGACNHTAVVVSE